MKRLHSVARWKKQADGLWKSIANIRNNIQ